MPRIIRDPLGYYFTGRGFDTREYFANSLPEILRLFRAVEGCGSKFELYDTTTGTKMAGTAPAI